MVVSNNFSPKDIYALPCSKFCLKQEDFLIGMKNYRAKLGTLAGCLYRTGEWTVVSSFSAMVIAELKPNWLWSGNYLGRADQVETLL